jgi:hypothetical protein
MTDTQWGQLALMVTTIGGFATQAWREARTRRWATEDRQAATESIIATAKAEAEATRIKTESAAETLRIAGVQAAENLRLQTALAAAQQREETRIAADAVRIEQEAAAKRIRDNSTAESLRIREAQQQHNAVVIQKIEESTAASKAAEVEANHSNLKIAETKAELVQLNQRLLDQARASTESAAATRTLGQDTLQQVTDAATVGADTHALAEQINKKVPDPHGPN